MPTFQYPQVRLPAGTKFPAPIGMDAAIEYTTPLGYTNQFSGGIHHVESVEARDDIQENFRQWGMLVHNSNGGDTGKGFYWKLQKGKYNSDIMDFRNWGLLVEIPTPPGGFSDVGKFLKLESLDGSGVPEFIYTNPFPNISLSNNGQILRVNAAGDGYELGGRISEWSNIVLDRPQDCTVQSTLRYKQIDSLVLLDGSMNFDTVANYTHTTGGQGFTFASVLAGLFPNNAATQIRLRKRILLNGDDTVVITTTCGLYVTAAGRVGINTSNDIEIDPFGNTPTKTSMDRATSDFITPGKLYTRHDGTTAAYGITFDGADSNYYGGLTLDLKGIIWPRGL